MSKQWAVWLGYRRGGIEKVWNSIRDTPAVSRSAGLWKSSRLSRAVLGKSHQAWRKPYNKSIENRGPDLFFWPFRVFTLKIAKPQALRVFSSKGHRPSVGRFTVSQVWNLICCDYRLNVWTHQYRLFVFLCVYTNKKIVSQQKSPPIIFLQTQFKSILAPIHHFIKATEKIITGEEKRTSEEEDHTLTLLD